MSGTLPTRPWSAACSPSTRISEAVIHRAALNVVPESVAEPVRYYEANVVKTLRLIETLSKSAATVWSSAVPPRSTCRRRTSASARSLRCPRVVRTRKPRWSSRTCFVRSLRHSASDDVAALFQPGRRGSAFSNGSAGQGADSCARWLIELTRRGRPFVITGDDYPTRDGTGIRDYVNVWDLAAAHLAALERFDVALGDSTSTVVNLGTGRGTTVRELIDMFSNVVRRPLEISIGPRRPGDAVGAFARTDRAERILGWKAQRSLVKGIEYALHWYEIRSERLPDLDS